MRCYVFMSARIASAARLLLRVTSGTAQSLLISRVPPVQRSSCASQPSRTLQRFNMTLQPLERWHCASASEFAMMSAVMISQHSFSTSCKISLQPVDFRLTHRNCQQCGVLTCCHCELQDVAYSFVNFASEYKVVQH